MGELQILLKSMNCSTTPNFKQIFPLDHVTALLSGEAYRESPAQASSSPNAPRHNSGLCPLVLSLVTWENRLTPTSLHSGSCGER